MLTRVIRETVMLKAATLQVAVMFSGSLMATENWPNYRGPTEAGHVASSQLPLHWSEAENVVWKTEIKGKAWSSPVIWGERVFLTNAPEDGSRLSVVCLDKESGKVLYDKVLHSVALPQYCHPFNSYASPSPVVEEGRLYVSFGSPYNGCLDSETGEVIWERTDLVCNHFRGPGSSPFLYKDFLIIHFDGSDEQYVAAFKKETGETVWRTDRTVDYEDVDPETGRIEREGDWRKAFSTPIIAEVEGRDVLISLGSMAIYGYDPTNGEELWRVEFPRGHSGACRPVFAHGLVYTLTGAGQELWAIRPDGRGVVTDSHVVWKHERTAVPRRPSIVVVDDAIYMIDDAGVAGCLDAHTGKLIWKGRVGGEYSSSLLHAGDRIYCFNQEGKAAVMKTGRKFELLAESQLDEGFMASPAVSGNALYLRTRTHLYRIED
ncbi:MAG: PQQ-like beta-propeller repeat protein [Planctomycetales bacterium]|nr:PQQ-like beta-propeller repeat protein [Planctomycetales bacterium]